MVPGTVTVGLQATMWQKPGKPAETQPKNEE